MAAPIPHTNEPKPEIEFEMSSVGTHNHRGGDASTVSSSQRDGVVYAEYDPEAAPQLFVPIPDDPEPVILPRTPTPERAFVLPADGEGKGKAAKFWHWIKEKPWLAAAIGTGIIGALLLLVLCPLLLRPMSSPADTSTSFPANSTNASATSTTSSTSASATPTHDPSSRPVPVKCNETLFTQHVTWMGISNAKGEVPWRLLPASDPVDCCTQCYLDVPEGCQGWWLSPSPGNKAPCTIIYGYQGNMPDNQCSMGHAYLSIAQDTKSLGSGAAGPCGTVT